MGRPVRETLVAVQPRPEDALAGKDGKEGGEEKGVFKLNVMRLKMVGYKPEGGVLRMVPENLVFPRLGRCWCRLVNGSPIEGPDAFQWKVIPSQPQGVYGILRQTGEDGCLSTRLEQAH